jgi:copper chaperone
MTETTTRNYVVKGMTCDHCRASVSEEVGEVAGVERVEVDLNSGRLEVRGQNFSDDQIKTAVEEAGYQVAAGR